MTVEVSIRPEVQMGTCPRDAGDMFQRRGEIGNVWVCGQCGLTTHGDPLDTASILEGFAAYIAIHRCPGWRTGTC
jgi:hypothetical protein